MWAEQGFLFLTHRRDHIIVDVTWCGGSGY